MGPAAAADSESITSYDTAIEVAADAQLRIVETIVYDFGANARHGILRKIPARFRYDDSHDRVYPIGAPATTVDGSPVPVERSTANGYEQFRIGDPGRTLTGVHTYTISYTVQGALNGFPDHDELYWNSLGDEWPVPVGSVGASVKTPAGITQARCFVGPSGSTVGCERSSVDGATATFHHSALVARSGMTVVVAVPPGSAGTTAPILVARDDLAGSFPLTPVTVGGASAVAMAGVVVVLLLVWRVGRDRRYVGLLPGLTPDRGEQAVERRKPLIGKPPVSVEFGPPGGIRPGQVGTLVDERADVLDVTATIVDFAVRRHLHIRQLRNGRDWELTKLTDGDPHFLKYEKTIFLGLFRRRRQVRLSELKRTFGTDLAKARSQLYDDLVKQGWYRQSPARIRRKARRTAGWVLLAAVLVTLALGLTTGLALLGVGLIIGALVLLAVAGRFPARTGRGSATLERIRGLRLYIATAEPKQMKFQEREQIFSEMLPYAMVFGLVDRWTRTFAQIGSQGAAGAEISSLYWYGGAAGYTNTEFQRSLDSFTSVTAGVVSATPSSVAGASGLSGGGGESGGGGGGGGGGSW